MEYPYTRVESIDPNAGLSSAIEFRIAKDETQLFEREADIVAALKTILEDTGLPPSTAIRYSVAQTEA